MKYKGEEIEFPATLSVSFKLLIESLIEKRKSCPKIQREYYDSILQLVEDNPWLKKPLSDKRILDEPEIINEFLSVVFPSVLETNEIKAATSPWNFNLLAKSKRMETILLNAGEDFQLEFIGLEKETVFIAACSVILGMHYKYPISVGRPYYISIPNKATGKSKTYRMTMNADFMYVEKTPKSIDITQDDYHELLDNYHNVALWKEKFPIDSWNMSGFLILSMMDVTNDRIISKITENLLHKSEDGLSILQQDLSELLEVDVSMSFVSLEGNQLVQGMKQNGSSLMLGGEESAQCAELLCEYSYNELIENDRPLAIPNVEAYHKKANNMLSKNLMKARLGSYFNAPVIHDGVKIGFIELGSDGKGALNSTVALKLIGVLPILAVAGNRIQQEQRNKIDALIQVEFTTIHPSVKWKFEQEAIKHFTMLENGEDHQISDLVFDDVYPLFGQLDIRSSSTIRNEAIKNDMLSQLNQAKKIIGIASSHNKLPHYQELIFVIDSYIHELKEDMVSASEQEILNFLNKEIEPVMEHLAKTNSDIKDALVVYRTSLHDDLHFVYNKRRDFDESVNLVNKTLAKYIDKKQIDAQNMFPHHFERYKTDGLEFNMYIGHSIAPNHNFHTLQVKNLRLWQIMVMVEMERELKAIQKKMKTPLDVASLILAFSNSLSIQFRMDEKRFDVEGAYNARYEIIKKRIDKAHIKGTKKRITEPGKMVVVFSRDDEEQEYLRYFRFLQSKGYIERGKVEVVTLEDLQGVSGLRAFRANINHNPQNADGDVTIEEIIAEIEGGKG